MAALLYRLNIRACRVSNEFATCVLNFAEQSTLLWWRQSHPNYTMQLTITLADRKRNPL